MKKLIFFCILSAFLMLFFNKKADTAILYKEYQTFKINGATYLCASHIVQEGDYLYKILKNKGIYSQSKINSLKNLNPHLTDINKIQPGQMIYLPIRTAHEGEFDGYKHGRILVPFITKKSVEDLLKEYAGPYEVKPGDTVSELLSRSIQTKWGTKNYERGIKLFKYLNPAIENINIIAKGQNINLPKSEVVNAEWYPSLFNPEIEKRLSVKKKNKINIDIPVTPKKEKTIKKKNILELIANTLEGQLESKGNLYIPYKEGITTLSLLKTPFIKSEIFPHIFFYEKNSLDKEKKEKIKNFYKEAVFFNLDNKLEETGKLSRKIFNINQIKMELGYENKVVSSKDSTKITEIFYIKDLYKAPVKFLSSFTKHNIILPSSSIIKSKPNFISLNNLTQKEFVRTFLRILECRYNENTQITFPFKGVQIKAYTNIAVNKSDKFLIIDFNEFYGETINSIKKIKMNITSIKHNDSNVDIAEKIAYNLNCVIIKNPVFPESVGYKDLSSVKIEIPGILIINNLSATNRLIFLPSIDSSKFPESILYYLDWLNIKTVFS
ncbi:MAG: LysM domain-containing protein [Desulforegulaceae bacterium]|nr:LysM domain-containing protein [Desulforegulaceae bacterium]